MIRLFFLTFLGLFLIACSGNSNSQKPMSNDLTQLENDWMHAMMKRDLQTLNQLVAPEFTVTGMKYIDSPAVTRSVWMQNTMQNMKIDSIHFINTKVSAINDIGIVRAVFYWSGSYDQNPFSDTTSFVDTWTNKNGLWQVISRVITD